MRKRVWIAVGTVAAGLAPPPTLAARAFPPELDHVSPRSVVVADNSGTILRAFANPDGRWRLPTVVADVDPRYLRILIAIEDQHFRSHLGIDPAAVVRAAGQMATHGRIVSGASTLTMQTARLLEPRPRGLV